VLILPDYKNFIIAGEQMKPFKSIAFLEKNKRCIFDLLNSCFNFYFANQQQLLAQ
jgi:hypothetical protein